VVALNKWDLIEQREDSAKRWQREIEHRLHFAKQVPLLYVSALTGQRVVKLLDEVDNVYASAGIRISTVELNRWLHGHIEADPNAPPPRGSLRLFYATQTGVHPPSFLVFCNETKRVHFSFRRRLENSLRERFNFGASPLRLRFRARRE